MIWCETFHLKLNEDKYCIMTFTNKRKYLSFDYAILSRSLPKVSAVKDLGATLTGNLHFKDQISRNIAKAFKMCGFIKRVCTTFTDVQASQSLYISLVRSQLEYCSVIWNPWQHTSIDKIEKKIIFVTNPKCSIPLTIILRSDIILDYRPFYIVGKLQI